MIEFGWADALHIHFLLKSNGDRLSENHALCTGVLINNEAYPRLHSADAGGGVHRSQPVVSVLMEPCDTWRGVGQHFTLSTFLCLWVVLHHVRVRGAS